MLFAVALTFLVVWVTAAAGLFEGGQLIHALLLVGLMLLLLAFLKARDAAAAAATAGRVAANGGAARASRSTDKG